MPRAGDYYHYKVHSDPDRDLNQSGSRIVTRYFRSSDEVAAYLGLCRSTIFNVLAGRTHQPKNYIIERCVPSLPVYEVVKLEDQVIS